MTDQSNVLRTGVYIDGYNLYYGRLRGTPYKWLDVVTLFQRIVRSIEPQSQVDSVKFYTAPALARFSRHGDQSMRAQNDYHRALEAKYPGLFTKVLGSHVFERDGTSLPLFLPDQPFDKSRTVKVWRLVEKKTDVNLAMGMYRDAARGQVDQVVLVSNDSDAEPVLQVLAEDFPALRIGVVMPLAPPLAPPDGARQGRPASTSLSQWAHWTRHSIRDDELQGAQLPDQVPTRKKPAVKPAHWQG